MSPHEQEQRQVLLIQQFYLYCLQVLFGRDIALFFLFFISSSVASGGTENLAEKSGTLEDDKDSSEGDIENRQVKDQGILGQFASNPKKALGKPEKFSKPLMGSLLGQEYDPENSLYYYNARYYDPSIGIFTTADTIIPDESDPLSYNRHMYVRGNPINYTDPSGHFFVSLLIAIGIGALVGGATSYVAHGISTGDWTSSAAGMAFGVGAVAGAVGGVTGFAVGVGVSTLIGGGALGSILGGTVGGAVGGASAGAAGASLAMATGAQNVDFWGAVWKGAAAGAIGGFIGGGFSALGQTFQGVSFVDNPLVYGPIAGAGGSVSGAAFYGRSGVDLAIAAGLGAGAGLFAAGLGLALNRLSQPSRQEDPDGKVNYKYSKRLRKLIRLTPRMKAQLLKLSKREGGRTVNVYRGLEDPSDAADLVGNNPRAVRHSQHAYGDAADISISGYTAKQTANAAYRSGLFNRINIYTDSGLIHVDLLTRYGMGSSFYINWRHQYSR